MPSHVTAVVVCGPSGVGKTTIGQLVAMEFNCPFVEGDEYHSAANVAKMASGTPLTDEDRVPWLHRLADEVIALQHGKDKVSVVLACSALRRSYRDVLRGAHRRTSAAEREKQLEETEVFFILLNGDASVVATRLANRKGHYMPPSLLASQLATLEPLAADELGATVDFCDPPAVIAKKAAQLVRDVTASSSL
jgi:carbohydrate kinase (thermoresistant glucokinase family)